MKKKKFQHRKVKKQLSNIKYEFKIKNKVIKKKTRTEKNYNNTKKQL